MIGFKNKKQLVCNQKLMKFDCELVNNFFLVCLKKINKSNVTFRRGSFSIQGKLVLGERGSNRRKDRLVDLSITLIVRGLCRIFKLKVTENEKMLDRALKLVNAVIS